MSVTGATVTTRSRVDVPGVDPAGVSFRVMPAAMLTLMGSRAKAITLGSTVFVHPDVFSDVVEGRRPELVAHELVHVRQWADDGVPVFLLRYFRDYVRLRLIGCSHDIAYRGVGYEWAAYTEARHIVEPA